MMPRVSRRLLKPVLNQLKVFLDNVLHFRIQVTFRIAFEVKILALSVDILKEFEEKHPPLQKQLNFINFRFDSS